MKARSFILSAVALIWPLAAQAGFEFSPASSPAQRQQGPAISATSNILTPEPSAMPIIPAIPVTAEPLAPPQNDRVLSRNVSRPQDPLQINPAPLQRRIPAPANQPFDGEALLDATILGAPIELAPDEMKIAAAPKREIDINLYPLQDTTKATTHNSIETLAGVERGMMEENGSLRPVAVPGGRIAPEQQGFIMMDEPAEFVPPTPARKPNVPVAAMSEPVRQEGFSDAVGFGRDLPLALALSQIVPAEYNYSFGQNVDAGVTVSWQGGKPWNEVLQDMLSQSGLRADLRGKQVMIKSAGL